MFVAISAETYPVVRNIYDTRRVELQGHILRETLHLPPVATAISSFLTHAIRAIRVLVMMPETPKPLGTIASQSSHCGVFVVNVAMTVIERRAAAPIDIVSQ